MRRDEFEKLALGHLDAVYRLALRLTRAPERAEDLVQDTYARALRPRTVEQFDPASARPGATPSEGMRAWLFTICHNLFYSRIKRDGRAPVAVGEFFGKASDGVPPDEPPPAWGRAGFDWEQVDGRLRMAVEELKEEYREVLLMWGVDGLKYREIAEILGVPIGTVMSRLHRARKMLADRLMEEPGAADDLGLHVRERAAHAATPRESGA
ncbi:MAG TPA: sigma-70 family RNA polymerase sigma factor [Phycisphaerales bacterium]|nr:sigma-70 family RNA polymerase sigma factor [Phycisphaerales bacterium]